APRPSRALWRLSGAAQSSAWGDPPDTTPARPRRAGGVPRVAVLELGAAAPAGLCTGYGALPVVSARDPAAHRRHHAGHGDPQDPPPSDARCRPPPHRAGPYSPSTL